MAVHFFSTATGNESVREWLYTLTKLQRTVIGADIRRVQDEWPIGLPHVRPMKEGIFEIRSNLDKAIARVLFFVDGQDIILLHGFIKKTQKTPAEELDLAKKRKAEYERYGKN